MKNEKGITLVALVITIIVLLILAAVSIAALSGQNGILTNADNSKQQTAISQAKEAYSTAISEIYTNMYAGVADSASTPSVLSPTAVQNSIKNNYGFTATVTASEAGTDGSPYVPSKAEMTVSGYTVTLTLDSNWKITDSSATKKK